MNRPDETISCGLTSDCPPCRWALIENMIEISVGPLAERRDSAEYVRVQTLFHRAGIMGIASIFVHQMLLRTDSMSQIANLVETRSEERRVGKECVRKCRSRWSRNT